MMGKGVLLLGAPGSGKSHLALQLIGLGADLIADDRVVVVARAGRPWLECPPEAPALVEMRGVGLLKASRAECAPLALVVRLDVTETERLPPLRHAAYGTHRVALFHNVTSGPFPMAIRQYLLHGIHDPDAGLSCHGPS